jgi:hypothetical protein
VAQEKTLVDGKVRQTNFNQHPLMRMKQAPPYRGVLAEDGLFADGAGRADVAADLAGGRERHCRG